MSDFYTLLTNAGLAAVTNATLTGTAVDVTEIAVGDGAGLPVQTMTQLRNEVWRGAITRLAQSASDASVLECETRIPPEDGGWTVREIGLFDDNGTLLAIGNLPESYKPVLDSGSGKDMQLRMYILSSNADDVTVRIDPAIIMASQAFVLEAVSKAKLLTAAAQIQTADAFVRIDIELGKTAVIEARNLRNETRFRDIETRLQGIVNRASSAILN